MNRTLTRAGAALLAGGLVLGVGGSAWAGTTSHAAHSKPTYDIAYEGPLSGGNAQLGLNMLYSVQLAINNANAGKSFGNLPFKLALVKADDQGSPTLSPTRAEGLVTNPSVVAVVGPAFSGATRAAEPTFSAANLATVSPSATNATLSQRGWHNFFRVVADDNAQGNGDAQYAIRALHSKKIYTIDDASTYGSGLAGFFDTYAAKYGVKPSHQTAAGTTQCQAGTGTVTEYGALSSEVARTLKGAHNPLVYYGGYYCDFSLLAKALRGAGYKGLLMSDDGSLDPHYVSESGKGVADGTYLSCACALSLSGKAASSFASSFKKLAHFPVGTYSGEAFDATNTIIDVMKSLGHNISRSAIVNSLHKVTYHGLTKTIHFLANGNVKGTAVYAYKVENGKIVQLGLISKLV